MPQAHMQSNMWEMTQAWWQWQPNWTMPLGWGMLPLMTPIPMASAQQSQQIFRSHVHCNAQQLVARWSLPPIGSPPSPNPQMLTVWQATIPTTSILGPNMQMPT